MLSKVKYKCFSPLLHSCASSLLEEIRVDHHWTNFTNKTDSLLPQLHSPVFFPSSFSKRTEKLRLIPDKVTFYWEAMPPAHPQTQPCFLSLVNITAVLPFLIGRKEAACHCLHCSLNWPIILDQDSSKSSFLFADPSL